jgi:hypothetical protein
LEIASRILTCGTVSAIVNGSPSIWLAGAATHSVSLAV